MKIKSISQLQKENRILKEKNRIAGREYESLRKRHIRLVREYQSLQEEVKSARFNESSLQCKNEWMEHELYKANRNWDDTFGKEGYNDRI